MASGSRWWLPPGPLPALGQRGLQPAGSTRALEQVTSDLAGQLLRLHLLERELSAPVDPAREEVGGGCWLQMSVWRGGLL